MHTIPRLFLLLAIPCLMPGVATLQARTRPPRVVKSIDISDNPDVRAAEKRRFEAVKALAEAEAKRDKAAIETALKEKEVAQKALNDARERAWSAAKIKSKR